MLTRAHVKHAAALQVSFQFQESRTSSSRAMKSVFQCGVSKFQMKSTGDCCFSQVRRLILLLDPTKESVQFVMIRKTSLTRTTLTTVVCVEVLFLEKLFVTLKPYLSSLTG